MAQAPSKLLEIEPIQISFTTKITHLGDALGIIRHDPSFVRNISREASYKGRVVSRSRDRRVRGPHTAATGANPTGDRSSPEQTGEG